MFESPIPCIVDLFGHDQIAGMVSELTIGGSSFIRVDVPASENAPAFTKLFGPSAIYAIAPVDEAIMLNAAKSLHVTPVQRWMLPAPLRLVEAGSQLDEEMSGMDDDPNESTDF